MCWRYINSEKVDEAVLSYLCQIKHKTVSQIQSIVLQQTDNGLAGIKRIFCSME